MPAIAMQSSSRSSDSRRGFTLIEVLVAVAILGILLTTVYGAVSRTMRSKELGEDRAELIATGREIVLRIADDVEGALLPSLGDSRYFFFEISGGGDPPMDELKFVAMHRGGFGAQSICPGPVVVTYALRPVSEGNEQLMLVRELFSWAQLDLLSKADQTDTVVEEKMDELEDEEAEACSTEEARPLLYCRDFPGELKLPGSCIRVAGLRFRYYDLAMHGFRDDWDSRPGQGDETLLNRLPAAVEISLYLMDERGRVEPFVTVVDIPLGVDQPTPIPGQPGVEEDDEPSADGNGPDDEDGDE